MRRLAWVILLAACSPEEKGGGSVGGAEAGAEPRAWNTVEWTVTRGGGGLTGRVSDPLPRALELAWTYEAVAGVTAEAVIGGGRVFVGDVTGMFHAIDLADGGKLWEFETGDSIEAAACLAGGLVIFGSNDGWLRALEQDSGKLVWQVEGEDKFTSGANPVEVGGEDCLLVNGYDGIARCLRLADGSVVWEYPTSNYINGSPAVVDGKWTVFGGCDAMLHWVGIGDGELEASVETEAYITSTVATLGDRVFSGNYANQVVAATAAEEAPLWVYTDRDFPFFSAPAVGEEAVFIGSRDKALHAIGRDSGEGLWKFPTGGRVESSPLVFDDAVVFGSSDGRLYALDPADGSEILAVDLGEELVAAPAFAGGTIVIGGGDGSVFALAEAHSENPAEQSQTKP